ncbi:MAG: glycosyltransferase [Acidobacteriota bacterium]|nr:glycosyltransferase [Acidobacteriota bacterium]
MENLKRPYFSILIPTYNRASFLLLAMKSVLEQTFEDFELIVSNGGSTDNTRDVVTSFDDERIKYVEANTRLSMGDNYQRAFDYAKGKFIIFFSDDDAFVPTMLERVERVIKEQNAKMVVFHTAFYYHERFEEFDNKIASNNLLFFSYSGETTRVQSQHALTQMLGNYGLVRVHKDTKHFLPFIGNIVCHNSIYNKIIQKTPRLFPIVPVDIYLVAMILGLSEEYYHLSEPLLVWSRWSKNATASLNMKGKSLRQHYEKLLEGEPLEQVPIKFALPYNLYANAMLQAKHDLLKGTNEDFEIDWISYFVNVYDDLMNLRSMGVEVSREICEFNDVLFEQPLELQKKVRGEISKVKFVAKQFIRNNLPFAKRALKRLLKGNSLNRQIIIHGGEAGFNNFLEAAHFLDNEMLPELFDHSKMPNLNQ